MRAMRSPFRCVRWGDGTWGCGVRERRDERFHAREERLLRVRREGFHDEPQLLEDGGWLTREGGLEGLAEEGREREPGHGEEPLELRELEAPDPRARLVRGERLLANAGAGGHLLLRELGSAAEFAELQDGIHRDLLRPLLRVRCSARSLPLLKAAGTCCVMGFPAPFRGTTPPGDRPPEAAGYRGRGRMRRRLRARESGLRRPEPTERLLWSRRGDRPRGSVVLKRSVCAGGLKGRVGAERGGITRVSARQRERRRGRRDAVSPPSWPSNTRSRTEGAVTRRQRD